MADIPTPKNSTEKLLYAIAVDGSEIPRPTTREEQYLAYIAEQGLGDKVSVSSTGTATDEVSYITINGTQKKLAGGGSGGTEYTLSVNATSTLSGETIQMNGAVCIIRDASNNELARATYAGTTLTFSLPKYQTYKVDISSIVTIGGVPYFNPTATNISGAMTTNITVNVTYSNTGTMSTLQEATSFVGAVNLATAKSVLIGEEGALCNFECNVTLTDPDTSTSYTMPIVAEDVYEAEDENGTTHNAIRWMCKYTLPVSRIWDTPERLQTSTGETFDANHTYFSSATETGSVTKLTAGTNYTVGDDIDTYKSTNNVYVFKNGLKNNSNQPAADTSIVGSGSNIYHNSNIDKWLNGSGTDWFEASYDGDICSYSATSGFKSWWSATDLACVKKVYYGIYERSGFEATDNKICREFVLPSGIELAGTNNKENTITEGTVFLRWKELNGGVISDSSSTTRVFTSVTATTSKQNAWCRSPYRSYSSYAWYLYSGGTFGNSSCGTSYAVAPSFTTY